MPHSIINGERVIELFGRSTSSHDSNWDEIMDGMSAALGLQAPAKLELTAILTKLEEKISSETLLRI